MYKLSPKPQIWGFDVVFLEEDDMEIIIVKCVLHVQQAYFLPFLAVVDT